MELLKEIITSVIFAIGWYFCKKKFNINFM